MILESFTRAGVHEDGVHEVGVLGSGKTPGVKKSS